MSLKRMLGLALVLGLTLPLVACDDVVTPPPPPPDPQIKVERHYQKALDKDGRTQIGLQNNDVYDVLMTTGGTLWVGNQDGIALFGDPTDTRRTDAFDQNNGLPNPKVRVLLESDGKLYVGTWGGGLGIYDIGAGTWMSLDTGDGLVNDLIADMKVDTDGAIIIATNGGVSRYNPVDGKFTNYKQSTQSSVVGDLLDPYVSALEIAQTPRGKEYWYMPRWESGITPGTESTHGITIARGAFNAPATADTFQASADNTLYEDANGALSNGVGQTIVVGTNTSGRRRGMIRFDIGTEIPTDATILSARLRFRNASATTSESRISLYRVQGDWGEGTSDATANPIAGAASTAGDATWRHTFYPSAFWNAAGGDYAATTSGSIDVRNTGFYTLTRPQMAADVQYWLANPSQNFGWQMQGSADYKQLASRENATVTSRPTLEVTYSRYIYMTEVNTDLPKPNVNDIYYDAAEDLFYLAFSTYGLAVVDVANATWKFYTTDNGLPSNVVYSIAKVDGDIWVGTQDGLAHMQGESFRSYARSGGLPGDRVRRVYSDQTDRLWLGLVEAGAAWVVPSTGQ